MHRMEFCSSKGNALGIIRHAGWMGCIQAESSYRTLAFLPSQGCIGEFDWRFRLQSRYSEEELDRNWQILQSMPQIHPDFCPASITAIEYAQVKLLSELLLHAIHSENKEKQTQLLEQICQISSEAKQLLFDHWFFRGVGSMEALVTQWQSMTTDQQGSQIRIAQGLQRLHLTG